MFYIVEPEVPGGLGPETVIDHAGGRLKVLSLQFEFSGWLGDALLTSHPVFVATAPLAAAMRDNAITGYVERDLKISASGVFQDLHPERELPEFRWIDVTGVAGKDDLGIDDANDLVVSHRALDLLQAHGIPHAIVRPAAYR